jgi:hypothetical protein
VSDCGPIEGIWYKLSLTYKYSKAQKIISGLNAEELNALREICQQIRWAENRLKRDAREVFRYCHERCLGLCCRNIQPDDMITLLDFIYALTLRPSLGEEIPQHVENEPFYTADCIFLAGGEGPCIFSPDLTPEKCVISFCGDDPVVSEGVRLVRSKFNQLAGYIRWRASKRFFSRFF